MTAVADWTVTPETAEKAEWLLAKGRLNIVVPDGGIEARVHGTSGWWSVRLYPDGRGECECPAFTRSSRAVCSHLLALSRVAEPPR